MTVGRLKEPATDLLRWQRDEEQERAVLGRAPALVDPLSHPRTTATPGDGAPRRQRTPREVCRRAGMFVLAPMLFSRFPPHLTLAHVSSLDIPHQPTSNRPSCATSRDGLPYWRRS